MEGLRRWVGALARVAALGIPVFRGGFRPERAFNVEWERWFRFFGQGCKWSSARAI
jgi:hypothetical protein